MTYQKHNISKEVYINWDANRTRLILKLRTDDNKDPDSFPHFLTVISLNSCFKIPKIIKDTTKERKIR